MRTRSLASEIMDAPHHPPEVSEQFHRDLGRIHRLLGNWNAVVERIRGSGARSVIDIGCGDGAFLEYIRRELQIQDVRGVDLQPLCRANCDVPILQADATCDLLPCADVAVSVVVLHHLSDQQVVDLIRNVGRSVKRFICLDLVRHPVPLALFSAFVTPLVHRIAAKDGQQSIRRSFRPSELRDLVDVALDGERARVEHWVSPIRAKQILDIRWGSVRN